MEKGGPAVGKHPKKKNDLNFWKKTVQSTARVGRDLHAKSSALQELRKRKGRVGGQVTKQSKNIMGAEL